jgi:hypothetical protein
MLIHQIANRHLSKAVYCKGGDGGAGASADATKQGIALQREMWQTNMQNLAPFTPLAEQYVSQLQNLSSLSGQQQALGEYYNSGQFKDLANQARYQQLASAEATGGLGSTATSNGLATIAPMLGQNWLTGQMNNYQNLANIGLGALTGQANAGQSYANNTGQLLQQQTGLAAASANKPSKLGGALQGAAAGAAAGTAIMPGWGTAIGAGVGALSSLF